MEPAMQVDHAMPRRGRWQFPLLVVSIIAFAVGLIRATPRPVNWPMHTLLSRGEQLLDQHQFTPAHQILQRAVHKKDATAEEHIQACRLLARLLHTVEKKNATHAVAQAEQIASLYEQVKARGMELTGPEYLHWADALEWSHQSAKVVPQLRSALHAGITQSGLVRRRIIELNSRSGTDAESLRADHDALLSDEAADPRDVAWSLSTWVADPANALDPAESLALIARVMPRLNGTIHAVDAALLEAQVLARANQSNEAERRLRHILSAGGPRDDIWARTSLMLADVLLSQGRAAEALTVFEAVHEQYAFRAPGTAARYGEARCRFKLEQFGQAVRDYQAVVADVGTPPRGELIHIDELRATLALQAAQLNDRGLARDGVVLLHLARGLLPGDSDEQRAAFASAEATLYLSIAQEPASPEADDATPALDSAPAMSREALYLAAADALLTVIQSRQMNDSDMAATLWRAMDALEAGGANDRNIPLLEQFIDAQPRSPRRAAALVRLAQLHHSRHELVRAAQLYEKVLDDYPRTQEGLGSAVPLAECLLAIGGDQVRRAEQLLTSVLDVAPQRESLLDPRAPQYADALFALGQLLLDEGRNEAAIARFEAFQALAPRDPRRREVAYGLGVAYQRSGTLLMVDGEQAIGFDARERVRTEALARLARAEHHYFEYIDSEMADNGDASLSAARLRSAWLARGDCLNDSGRWDEARALFAEVVWRYDGEPTGLTAMLRLIDCDRRAGRAQQADAALRRLWWLVHRMDESAFSRADGSPNRAYWVEWIDRMIDVRGS